MFFLISVRIFGERESESENKFEMLDSKEFYTKLKFI